MPDKLTDADIEAAIANGHATLAILDARKDSYSGNPSALLPAIDEGLRAVVSEQLTVLAELKAARLAYATLKAERDAARKAMANILVPTNFISLEAARDYVSEVLGVGRYAERGPNPGAGAVYTSSLNLEAQADAQD